MYPIGHEQLEECPLDLQMALAPHGSTLHESRHVPSTHLSGSRQSRSVTQDGVGVTASKHVMGADNVLGACIPLGLHSPLGPMNVSSGHVQRTVLMGELFSTRHVCVV